MEEKRKESKEQIKKRVSYLRNRYAEAGLITQTIYIFPEDLQAVMSYDKRHIIESKKAGRPKKI